MTAEPTVAPADEPGKKRTRRSGGEPTDLFTVDEVAVKLRRSKRWVYEVLACGELAYVDLPTKHGNAKINGRGRGVRLVARADLDAFITSHRVVPDRPEPA